MRCISIFFVCTLLGCVSSKTDVSANITGKYIYIDKTNNFYDELMLTFSDDGNFEFAQRVGQAGFSVTGRFAQISKTNYSLIVLDTPLQVWDGPIHSFYKVKDTLRVINENKLLLNGRKFKRQEDTKKPNVTHPPKKW